MSRKPIIRIGANTFCTKHYNIILRRDTESIINAVLRDKKRKLVYLIDDDIEGGMEDRALPQTYRKELRRFHKKQHSQLVNQADELLVSSEYLQKKFKNKKKVTLLRPYWSEPLSGVAHFENLKEKKCPVRIAALGSFTHQADHHFVDQVLLKVIPHTKNIEVILAHSNMRDSSLANHKNVNLLPSMPWSEYRKTLPHIKAHICLYPLLNNNFNKGRSPNKLIEHAVAGGVSLCTDDWQYAKHIQNGQNGFTCARDSSAWAELILNLIDKPTYLTVAFNQFLKEAICLNNKQEQREIWCRLLF
ncbi:glycosyltransferase family protein [Flexibacterium corallicola]|uniref:hypothetical protein n=1 Tax=Flexibacterium corallicola TaxID=3037259 RepID=UPI00286FAA75|nr:hypothetical protein [Pseudovibrio sp. M1P-2-3]